MADLETWPLAGLTLDEGVDESLHAITVLLRDWSVATTAWQETLEHDVERPQVCCSDGK